MTETVHLRHLVAKALTKVSLLWPYYQPFIQQIFMECTLGVKKKKKKKHGRLKKNVSPRPTLPPINKKKIIKVHKR